MKFSFEGKSAFHTYVLLIALPKFSKSIYVCPVAQNLENRFVMNILYTTYIFNKQKQRLSHQPIRTISSIIMREMREIETHKSVRIVQYIKILEHVNVLDLVLSHIELAVSCQQLGYVAITDTLFYRPEGDVRP